MDYFSLHTFPHNLPRSLPPFSLSLSLSLSPPLSIGIKEKDAGRKPHLCVTYYVQDVSNQKKSY